MESKHTPGPWRVSEVPCLSGGPIYLVRGEPQYPTVAECGQKFQGTDGEANARLIAAAPELLEAISALWQAVGSTGWKNASPRLSERESRAAILNHARAAIAKATGN